MSDFHKGRYERFIASRPLRSRQPGLEEHHVLPRSLGGSDDPSNLILLTPRERFLAHMMLAKAYGGPMISALFMMSTMGKYRAKSRLYESAKLTFSLIQSQKVGEKNNRWGTTHSEETKRVMAEKATGRTRSKETRVKLRANWAERGPNEKAIAALTKMAKENNPFKGKAHSDESKSLMSEKAFAYKYTCEHCGKTGGRVMHRWHGDRCKQKGT